jgi:hypothetical protein
MLAIWTAEGWPNDNSFDAARSAQGYAVANFPAHSLSVDNLDQKKPFLSTLPPGTTQKRAALVVVVILIIAFSLPSGRSRRFDRRRSRRSFELTRRCSFPVPIRFSMGWYAGRTFGWLASAIVLIVFLCGITSLYARMLQAAIGQRRIELLRLVGFRTEKRHRAALSQGGSACALGPTAA